MDNSAEVSDFLATRRAKIQPSQVGLPPGSTRRRVPGLRRTEVAMLAGVSVDYYVRLERGNIAGVSEGVLDAIARALLFDESERAHLADLAAVANSLRPRRRQPQRRTIRPSLRRVLDAMSSPAWVRNGHLDVLAANDLGRALYAPLFDSGGDRPNLARFVFLDRAAQEFFVDWHVVTSDVVAALRTELGRTPFEKGLSDLVGELATRSEPFRELWAAHEVRMQRAGAKRLVHPIVGALDLDYEGMDLRADPGLRLLAYTAEPGSSSEAGLTFLASWAATLAPDERSA